MTMPPSFAKRGAKDHAHTHINSYKIGLNWSNMNKPPDELIKLCEIGNIHGLDVEYRQVGTDTSETILTIIGTHGSVSGLSSRYVNCLDLGIDYCSVARVKENLWKLVEDWKKFENANAAELAEYARLKKKFG
jgi:hypothetical protein